MIFELKSRKHFRNVMGEYIDLDKEYSFDVLYTVFRFITLLPENISYRYPIVIKDREELEAENKIDLDNANLYIEKFGEDMTEEDRQIYIEQRTLDEQLAFMGESMVRSHGEPYGYDMEYDSSLRMYGDGFQFYIYYDGSWELNADNPQYKYKDEACYHHLNPFITIKFPDGELKEEEQFRRARKIIEDAYNSIIKW